MRIAVLQNEEQFRQDIKKRCAEAQINLVYLNDEGLIDQLRSNQYDAVVMPAAYLKQSQGKDLLTKIRASLPQIGLLVFGDEQMPYSSRRAGHDATLGYPFSAMEFEICLNDITKPLPPAFKPDKNKEESPSTDSKAPLEVPAFASKSIDAEPIEEVVQNKAKPMSEVPVFNKQAVRTEPSSLKREEPLPEKSAERPAKKQKSAKKKRAVLRTILAVFLLMFASAVGYIGYNLQGVPNLDTSLRSSYSEASKVYDINGELLFEYGSNENIEWISINDVPQQLQDAIVSIEDKRFYSHKGIDIRRLTGAVLGQLTGSASYGGSTITQQLIKNAFLTQEVSYRRKIQEIYLALQLEKEMSKQEILEWYVNIIFMGGSNYGIANAARDYFGKSVSELTLRESACLAGVIQSPNNYNPRTTYNKGDMSLTDRRTNTVLYAMLENGKITREEYDAAVNDTLVVAPVGRQYEDNVIYLENAYFIDYAMDEIAEAVLKQEGTVVTDDALYEKKQYFRNAGYSFYLTLDPSIQSKVQTAASEFNNYPVTATESQAEFSGVVIDQHTGEIRAMIGGRNQAETAEGYNRAVDSKQAVGSSIKPLSVYAPALEEGDYPGTVVDDMPYEIQGYGTNNGWPSGDYIDGPITMRRALEMSHNIPAARFLLEHVGIQKSYQYMVDMGFAPEEMVQTAAGFALGANDVTTLEMTGAYATLANGGIYIEPHTYTVVYDRLGNLVTDDSQVESHRVFSEETAWLATDMMERNMTEGLGVNARLRNVNSCGKTGTHEHKVVSFGGYTGYYTCFIRISTDDYTDFTNSSSYYQAASLWRQCMEPVHEGLSNRAIQDKGLNELEIHSVYVCNESGLLATEICEAYGHAYTEYCEIGHEPTETCFGHSDSEFGYMDPETGLWVDGGWWSEDGTFHPFE